MQIVEAVVSGRSAAKHLRCINQACSPWSLFPTTDPSTRSDGVKTSNQKTHRFEAGPEFPERLASFITFCTFGILIAGISVSALALL